MVKYISWIKSGILICQFPHVFNKREYPRLVQRPKALLHAVDQVIGVQIHVQQTVLRHVWMCQPVPWKRSLREHMDACYNAISGQPFDYVGTPYALPSTTRLFLRTMPHTVPNNMTLKPLGIKYVWRADTTVSPNLTKPSAWTWHVTRQPWYFQD